MGRYLGVRHAIGLAVLVLCGGCTDEPEWASLFERQPGEDAGVRFADAGDANWDAHWEPDDVDAGGLWHVRVDGAPRDGCVGACSLGDAAAGGGADAARADAGLADGFGGADGLGGAGAQLDGSGADWVADAGAAGELLDAAGVDDASLPQPTAGGVVITEVMSDPEVGAERYGEWFELYNPSLGQAVNLRGCELRDAGRDRHVIGDDLILRPGSYLVLASSGRAEDLGFVADYVYSNFALANADDELILACAEGLVDELAYGGSGPTPRAGVSLSLDPCQTSAAANDRAEAWCSAHHVYNPPGAVEGDRATPGQGNPPCASGP